MDPGGKDEGSEGGLCLRGVKMGWGLWPGDRQCHSKVSAEKGEMQERAVRGG